MQKRFVGSHSYSSAYGLCPVGDALFAACAGWPQAIRDELTAGHCGLVFCEVDGYRVTDAITPDPRI